MDETTRDVEHRGRGLVMAETARDVEEGRTNEVRDYVIAQNV